MFEHYFPNPDAPVLIIGAAGVDIVGSLSGELRMGTSNPSRIRSSFGGVARNVAENLARLGHAVQLISAVGDDEAGEQLLDELEEARVDISGVKCCSDLSTGSYLAVVDQQGALELALDDMGVIGELTPDYLKAREQMFKEAALVFIDANLPKKTIRTALSLAHRAHIPVIADPTSVALMERLRPYIDRLFMLIPNEFEARLLVDPKRDVREFVDPIDSAKGLVSMGTEVAIVTLAQFGVCYATAETSGQLPAIQTDIVDPTGAGDALLATVIFALLNEIDLDDAIRLGVSAASMTLRHAGAVRPDLTLEKLYDQLVI